MPNWSTLDTVMIPRKKWRTEDDDDGWKNTRSRAEIKKKTWKVITSKTEANKYMGILEFLHSLLHPSALVCFFSCLHRRLLFDMCSFLLSFSLNQSQVEYKQIFKNNQQWNVSGLGRWSEETNINKLCLTQREEKRERRWIVKKKHLRASNLTKLNTRIEEEV